MQRTCEQRRFSTIFTTRESPDMGLSGQLHVDLDEGIFSELCDSLYFLGSLSRLEYMNYKFMHGEQIL